MLYLQQTYSKINLGAMSSNSEKPGQKKKTNYSILILTTVDRSLLVQLKRMCLECVSFIEVLFASQKQGSQDRK